LIIIQMRRIATSNNNINQQRAVAPKTMAKVFQILCTLDNNSNNASSNINQQNNEQHQQQQTPFMNEFYAKQVLEYFWLSATIRKLSCAECLNLCLLYIQRFGINEYFEEQFLIPVAQHHLIESVSLLDAVELNNALELIALFALEATTTTSSSSSGSRTRKNILTADHSNDNNALTSATAGTSTGGANTTPSLLITSTFYDAVLEQLIMLRETAAAVWPVRTALLPQLKSLAVLVTCMKNEEALRLLQQQQQSEFKNFIQLHRPKLHAAVKSLCASIISATRDSMSANDCAVFLAVAASLGDYVLDSSISAVVKRLVSESTKSSTKKKHREVEDNSLDELTGDIDASSSVSLIDELSIQQIQDLLLVWRMNYETDSSSITNTKPPQKRAIISNILIPALKEAERRKMVMDLS
jgi:hypothetical protein